MIPNRASDAGPDSRYKTYECSHCGETYAVTFRCQGSVKDSTHDHNDWCAARICGECGRGRCGVCKLPVCADHLSVHPENPDVQLCDVCRRDLDDDCRCVRVGDIEDASDCSVHGGGR